MRHPQVDPGRFIDRLGTVRCERPAEPARPLTLSNSADRRHLADDAQGAEDIAIGYADVTRGIRSAGYISSAVYRDTREACLTTLFTEIAQQHSVSVSEVRAAVAWRRAWLDLLVIMSFLLIYYATVGPPALRRAVRAFPGEKWPTIMAVIFAGVLVSIGCLGLGEMWSAWIEELRVDNTHLSYRMARIPWTQHRLALFFVGLALFGLIGILRRRSTPREWYRGSLVRR